MNPESTTTLRNQAAMYVVVMPQSLFNIGKYSGNEQVKAMSNKYITLTEVKSIPILKN